MGGFKQNTRSELVMTMFPGQDSLERNERNLSILSNILSAKERDPC